MGIHGVMHLSQKEGFLCQPNLQTSIGVIDRLNQGRFNTTERFKARGGGGGRNFLYSLMGELVCSGQLWARAALKQLPSDKVG